MAKRPAQKYPPQPRIRPEIAVMVAQSAARNSRSIPQEVNHVLREHYTAGLQRCLGLPAATAH